MSIDKIKARRQALQLKDQSKKDMLSLAYYIQQSNKPADITKELDKLGDKLSNIKVDDTSAKEIKAIAEQYKDVAILLSKYQEEQTKQIAEGLKSLADTLDGKETQITVEGKEIDVAPIVEAIKSIRIDVPPPPEREAEEKGIDLDDYHASDIKNADDLQYIGFVAPNGNWYIMENDTKKETLRYVFGDKNYKSAFKKAGTWEYKILSEAINAVQA